MKSAHGGPAPRCLDQGARSAEGKLREILADHAGVDDEQALIRGKAASHQSTRVVATDARTMFLSKPTVFSDVFGFFTLPLKNLFSQLIRRLSGGLFSRPARIPGVLEFTSMEIPRGHRFGS